MRASPIERVVKDCVVGANVTIEPGVAVLKTDQSHRLSAKSCNRTRTGNFWCFFESLIRKRRERSQHSLLMSQYSSELQTEWAEHKATRFFRLAVVLCSSQLLWRCLFASHLVG